MNGTANTDLIAAFAALAREPYVMPTPAPAAELDAALRSLRRRAQIRFNEVGLPRGLRLAS